MALKEYYLGTVGPLYIDDTDPSYSDPGQVATKADVVDGITTLSDTVSSETTFGISASAGTSDDVSRSDHTHGTPANPVAGVTSNITVVTDIGPPQVTSVLHFTNGLLTSVT